MPVVVSVIFRSTALIEVKEKSIDIPLGRFIMILIR
jgi:hypothetical protein